MVLSRYEAVMIGFRLVVGRC